MLAVLRLKPAPASSAQPALDDQAATIRAALRYLDGGELSVARRVRSRTGDFSGTIRDEELYQLLPRLRQAPLPLAVDELLRARSVQEDLGGLRRWLPGLNGMVGSLEDALEERASLIEITEVAANFEGGTLDFVTTMDRALQRAEATRVMSRQPRTPSEVVSLHPLADCGPVLRESSMGGLGYHLLLLSLPEAFLSRLVGRSRPQLAGYSGARTMPNCACRLRPSRTSQVSAICPSTIR